MSNAKQCGPIYGVALIEIMPFGGMKQAMPSRADLKEAAKVSERTAAGYEVLLSRYREQGALLEVVREYRDHYANVLNGINSCCGHMSINNGTSTLAIFIDDVLSKQSIRELHDGE